MSALQTELRALPELTEPDAPGLSEASRFKLPVTAEGRARLRHRTMCVEIAAGMGILAFFGPQFHGNVTLFAVLVALNLIAERMPISIYGDARVTVGFVFTLPIIALFGAPGAAIVAPLEAIARNGRAPLELKYARQAFSGVTAYAAGAAAYSFFAPTHPGSFDLNMIPAAAAATGLTYALLVTFVSWNRALLSGVTIASVWSDQRWVALHYAAFGIVGFSFLSTYITVGYWGLLAYLTPILMLRWSMKQYVDKTSENVRKLKERNQELEEANVQIRKISNDLRINYGATLEALVNALEARDQETKGHSIRVAHYMLTIAEAFGVKPRTQDYIDMQHGALLHDVGKIGVRDAILLKPGSLTPEEWELMRKHPEIGFNILREVKFLHGAANIVLAHHERWDGAGYPYGLKAEEIPLGSRIFAVVDTFDTMTSDRIYRKALSTQEALDEILRCSGSQFDPLVVEAFLDIYDEWVVERDQLHLAPPVFKAA